MSTWEGDQGYPVTPRKTPLNWLRVIVRGSVLFVLVFGGLLLLLLLRLLERPLCGLQRPVTPNITRFVCRNAFRVMGIRFEISGQPMRGQGAIVANHGSWLDIFSLNAAQSVYFVSKAEVAKWPGIGWLAKATGTVFINRNRAEAAAQKAVFQERLNAGHELLFFPEGTSSDGQRILPFKSTLFAAFFEDGLREYLRIQPVTVHYHAPQGADVRFYGWWGDMEFASHLLGVLAAPRQGRVKLTYHAPVAVQDFPDRKALAFHCEQAVRGGFEAV